MLDSREARSFVGGALVAAGALGAAWSSDAWRRRDRTRRLHRVMVDLLLNAITAGDEVTARHSRRVADLTDSLAGALRMERRERTTLRIASLLHDMGKIDDRFFDIVHTRTRLTPEQRAEIKTHPHESAHILAPLEEIHPGIMRIVSSHHECWDGTGYPHGTEGEQIPLSARVISVADVFDALSQPRTYRDPLSAEQVLEKIREGSGTQFDPRIVRLLDRPDVWTCWEGIARRGREEECRKQEEDEEEEATAAPSGRGSRAGAAG